jgi:signal transduction histidine kinase
LFSVRLPEFTRSTTFRWTLLLASAFALAIFGSFAFVYVQAIYDILTRIDAAITEEADIIASQTPERRLQSLQERMRQDPRRVKPIGLFSADGNRLAGNIESLPSGLPIDAAAQDIPIVRIDVFGREPQTARATARRLSNGDILLVAWSNDYGFSQVALADLVREVGDLYEPIAEDKRVVFTVGADEDVTVRGDRDLLFEAIANLVDNAVKFTPEGGRVELSLSREGDEGIVRVRDTGPGIAAAEHDFVARRFYRSDKSRTNPGLGLGLSLVAAIVKLHGFRFTISPGPGCVVEIAGQHAAA